MRAARKGEKPLVSVIMFVYNHAPYLKQAIESVLMQEGSFPAEILIHDDASSDGSAEIIRTYAKRFPDLIVPLLESENQTRQGINYVDHTIMPRLSGTYIAHCEGDDYWTDPKKLKKQVRILEKHPEYAAVTHNCTVVDAHGRRKKPVGKFYPFRRTCVYTLRELSFEARMPGQTATVVYRSSIQKDMPVSEKEHYQAIRSLLGDRRRTLLILLNGPVLCLNRSMSAYRLVIDSGQSWNARAKGKNLAGALFMQEWDFRKFAADSYGIHLENDFALFGTGLMSLIRAAARPSEANLKQKELAVSAAGGERELLKCLLESFFPALLVLTKRPVQELRWRL